MKKKIFILIVMFICVMPFLLYGQEGKNQGFLISTGDVVEVSVYGTVGMHNPPIKARVSAKGTVIMPLLGEVEVAGSTAEDAAKKLDKLFSAGYLSDPQVTVFISERSKTAEKRISVLGAVSRPGNYEVLGKTSLVNAILIAGGASKPPSGEHPDLTAIKVMRKEDGGERAVYVDLEKEGRDFFVQPGDIIVVEEYGGVVVLGNVAKPGAVRIYSNFSLANAIQFAGGPLPNANLSKIQVVRREKNDEGSLEERTHVVDYLTEGPYFIIQQQDRIIVEAYGTFTIYGEVGAPGNYYISEDLTAMDAIILAGNFTEYASKNGVKIIRYVDGKRKAIKVPAGYIIKTGNRSKDVFLEDGDTIVVPESWF